MGAWIETQVWVLLTCPWLVAPRVGAWIETRGTAAGPKRAASHPVWVRGLKHTNVDDDTQPGLVALRVGAWIETTDLVHSTRNSLSHPVWVRGLKRTALRPISRSEMSHPVWVRGLKQPGTLNGLGLGCRTPCGCVD